MGGGGGGFDLGSGFGSGSGCGYGRMGESGRANFHWVKLWEVEEEEDSDSGLEGWWVGGSGCVGAGGDESNDSEGGNGSVDEKGRGGG